MIDNKNIKQNIHQKNQSIGEVGDSEHILNKKIINFSFYIIGNFIPKCS